ncbi:unnamed protein product [Thelazia callipaeda]|uniref:Glyoxylate reductase/hydroxypyruvate reductase n=1 Tax=Thelazia callipaeda TaxID=103827 RepID=A0A0N5D0T1_THECL|nr:unnamed protein product [Thelazia callipaeda]
MVGSRRDYFLLTRNMKILRLLRKSDALNILVTACDLDVTQLNKKYNVIQWGEPGVMPKEILIKEITNAQALVCLLRDKIDSDVLKACTDLRVISTLSVGYDHINLEECKKRGIIVTNTPDVLTEVTAETTVALLLATARRFPEAINEAKTGKWGTWSLYYINIDVATHVLSIFEFAIRCGVGLHHSTVGIIGMGRIGAARVGAEYVALEKLLNQSDFVILTCAYSPELKELINKDTLSKMKKNAILINTSRGALINHGDLYVALHTGQIRAAGLDVTNPEPLPMNNPLFSLQNCVILPHIGSATEFARTEMFNLVQDTLPKMQNIIRSTKFSNAASVLITAGDITVPRIYDRFNVCQYKEVKSMPKNVLMEEIPKHEGLYCLLRDKIDKELISAAKKLRVISSMSVGFDHIDVEECKKRNIVVTVTPNVLTETTAETTIGLLIATARRFPEAIREVKTGGWGTWSPYYMCGVGLRDSTIGIIGMGRIGASVAEKLKSFHPNRILFYDISYDQKKTEKLGIDYACIDDLYSKSDFIILNCVATENNKGMINKNSLSKMKRNAVLINTSRGTLINQKDLYEALTKGQIRAAGLDVTTPEPLPLDDPLLKLDNCVILPHVGSATEATRKDMMRLAETCLIEGLTDGKIPDDARIV